MKKISDYRYFIFSDTDVYAGVVANEKHGAVFYRSGKSITRQFNFCYKESEGRNLNYLRTTFKEVLSRFESPAAQQAFLKFLDISYPIKQVKLTKNKISHYIKLLESSYAYNGDCAHFIKDEDWEIFDNLLQRKIVCQSCLDNNMYYLAPNYKELI